MGTACIRRCWPAIGAALIGSDHYKKLKRLHVSKGDAMLEAILDQSIITKKYVMSLKTKVRYLRCMTKILLFQCYRIINENKRLVGFREGWSLVRAH